MEIQIANSINILIVKYKYHIFLAIPLVFSFIVHSTLLTTFFWRDDFLHFYQLSNDSALKFIFMPYGGHLYIARNMVFYGMFKLFGLYAPAYFTVVIATHLLVVFLLFNLIWRLINDLTLASIGASIWGICPVNHGPLGWYSTYGHILMTVFFLMLLYELIRIANGEGKFTKLTAIRWYILLFIIASSFGIGIALTFIFPFLVWILVEKKKQSLNIIFSILPCLFVIFIIFLLRVHIYAFITDNPQALSEFRLQSNYMEPLYWLSVAELFYRFIAYNLYMMSAFPLDYFIPSQYYNIISNVIIVVFLFCFLWLLAKTSSQQRRYYFTFSCLVTSIYAILAIGRAWTSMVFNLSLSSTAMTPRYHYSALLMMIVLLCLMISDVKTIYSFKLRFIQGILFIALLLCLYPSWRKGPHIDFVNTAENERLLYYSTISDIENEVEKHPEGATVFLDNAIKDHFSIFMPSDTDFPDRAAVFIIRYPTNIVKGRRVYFIENNTIIVEKVRKKKWRIAELLVTQEEARAGKIP